jgi:hypothetical protein
VLRCLIGILIGLSGCSEGAQIPAALTSFVPYEQNPVLSPRPGRWDAQFRERGWVLKDGGIYHLWYTGAERGGSCPGALGYATSSDGLSWVRQSESPVYMETWIEDATVVKQGGIFYMFAEGVEDQAQLLTSQDGAHWDRVGTLDIRREDGSRLSRGPFGTPAVLYKEGIWYLFYERLDDGIWLATSRDLKTFTNVSDQPVLGLGPGPYDEIRVSMNQVFEYAGRYYAYYNGQGRSSRWTTNIAVSDDLVHWAKYAGNPLSDQVISIAVADGPKVRLYVMSPEVQVYLPR